MRECTRHQAISTGKHVDHTHPLCFRCLHCYAVSPVGAIDLAEEYVPFNDDVGKLRTVTPKALEYLVACRRSTRRFLDRPVPRDLIERVVQAGRYIPSGGNRRARSTGRDPAMPPVGGELPP